MSKLLGGLYDMHTGVIIDSRNAKNGEGVPVLPSPYELESHICLIGDTLPESVVVTRGSKDVESVDLGGNTVRSTVEIILVNGKEYRKGTCAKAVDYE